MSCEPSTTTRPALDSPWPRGLTAYVALFTVGRLTADATVWTSALPLMRGQGRVVVMGRVGAADHGPVLDDISLLIGRRLTRAVFSVTDHDTT